MIYFVPPKINGIADALILIGRGLRAEQLSSI
jgi:hypothetical protein